MAVDLKSLREIVESRAFDRLVGEVENQFFDAKGQPYQFDVGSDGKREFAKDVAAFANANGGYIFIGLATARATLRAGDEVTDVRPLEHALFDSDRHHKVLGEWLFPQPEAVKIDWIQFGHDSGKGVGVIFIPPQNDEAKPFLITRAIVDKKSTELLIGYVERRLDRTEVRSVVEIHHALRNGLNLGRELLGRMANIEVLLERVLSERKGAATAEKKEQVLGQRIARILEEDGGSD